MPETKVLSEFRLQTGQVVRVCQGDITEQKTMAIVNAANEHLQHGGGVAGAIRRRGGEEIQEESDRWVQTHGLVKTGKAAITGGGRLPAKYVIHAVGPIWGSGDEERKLASAVRNTLLLADEKAIESLSIPGISSGIFGGLKEICARVIVGTVLDYLRKHPDTNIREVDFCNIDHATTAVFAEVARELVGGSEHLVDGWLLLTGKRRTFTSSSARH